MPSDLPPLPGRGKISTRVNTIQGEIEKLQAQRGPGILTDMTTAGIKQRGIAKARAITAEGSTSIVPRWG